ncbi:TIGR03571 family LLM class oxidoreductase [Testudinibacter aquarius]|uniref:Luciferase-type oxidoreductase n=1 Tax=Testudinibacter aquarius TaxID=1524974 RepID=A0A4R3YEF8_9PAST|nr:TIGR03571 family LLM class oxidoreductase [Testudinibacter aquarius]KAE9528968.1 dehydrogenase [Testudinibacter aquarius]TCV89244.1 luciferase-type oxidoreductase [Testudinibacter aquarius]TNG93373.1 TIGR03571 family LLM class oxidoreductase [Testudinibacter aquarius]
MNTLVLPDYLQHHAGFSRTFVPNRLTLGVIAPFLPYPDSPFPDLESMGQMAKMADDGGVAALWVRDVPLYDPAFGDVGQAYDTSVMLGYLSAMTKRIAIGTAGYVSPLRNPILTAKEATSADQLSGGRFILGLASGDRPVEYPVFQQDFDQRAERFRENWQIIRTLSEQKFPVQHNRLGGSFTGNLDLVPKPVHGRLPMIAIGRARQEISWFANQADAWIWHGVAPEQLRSILKQLRELGDGKTWKPFGYGIFVELSENAHEPVRLFNHAYLRGGSKGLVEFWQEQEAQGVAHVSVNFKPSRRPAVELMQDFVENIMPHFQAA